MLYETKTDDEMIDFLKNLIQKMEVRNKRRERLILLLVMSTLCTMLVAVLTKPDLLALMIIPLFASIILITIILVEYQIYRKLSLKEMQRIRMWIESSNARDTFMLSIPEMTSMRNIQPTAKRNGLIDGIGSVLDIGGIMYNRRVSNSPYQADYDAIYRDWDAVGGDLRKAISRTAETVETVQPNAK